jgi:hypothetical protein
LQPQKWPITSCTTAYLDDQEPYTDTDTIISSCARFLNVTMQNIHLILLDLLVRQKLVWKGSRAYFLIMKLTDSWSTARWTIMIWLVVLTILKNMNVNGKDGNPYIMENRTCLKPPTSDLLWSITRPMYLHWCCLILSS